MSKRFWQRSFSFVLMTLLIAVPLVSAESSSVPAPIFTDENALDTQLRTYQKATAEQTQDELEPGLQSLLKSFPDTTVDLYPAASAGSVEPPPIYSGTSWILKNGNWYASEVYPWGPDKTDERALPGAFLGLWNKNSWPVGTQARCFSNSSRCSTQHHGVTYVTP
jgi:hypothetical protein